MQLNKQSVNINRKLNVNSGQNLTQFLVKLTSAVNFNKGTTLCQLECYVDCMMCRKVISAESNPGRFSMFVLSKSSKPKGVMRTTALQNHA